MCGQGSPPVVDAPCLTHRGSMADSGSVAGSIVAGQAWGQRGSRLHGSQSSSCGRGERPGWACLKTLSITAAGSRAKSGPGSTWLALHRRRPAAARDHRDRRTPHCLRSLGTAKRPSLSATVAYATVDTTWLAHAALWRAVRGKSSSPCPACTPHRLPDGVLPIKVSESQTLTIAPHSARGPFQGKGKVHSGGGGFGGVLEGMRKMSKPTIAL